MQTVALIIHLLLAIALIVVVLLQRSEGGGLGIGGGNQAGLFASRGRANALSRATAILGACFMGTSLFLAIMAGQTEDGHSIFDQTPQIQTQPAASDAAGDATAPDHSGDTVPLVE